jgi:hypothetical protein
MSSFVASSVVLAPVILYHIVNMCACMVEASWVTGKRFWLEGIGVCIRSCNGDHRSTLWWFQIARLPPYKKIALFCCPLPYPPFHLALQIVLWCSL